MRGSALVVGGGIAGLAVARGLILAGWDVEVRERAATLPAGGTALGMWPQAMTALDRLGLGDAVRARSVEQHGAQLLRPDGRVLVRVGADRGARLVSRRDLLETLAAGLPPRAVRWGCRVDDLQDLPETDLVVGADGIRSTVRDAGWSAAPRPLGTVALRGTVPGAVAGVTETWGRGRLFGITPNGDGTVNWFACVRAGLAPTGQDAGATVATLRELFGTWHAGVTTVLDALDPAQVDRRRLEDVPPLRTYVRERTVLVGDSAHAMAPNLGRGACESLVDAVALTDALTASPDVAQALRRYDAARLRRTGRVVRLARLMNRVSTAEAAAPLRDLALTAVGGGRRAETRLSTARDTG